MDVRSSELDLANLTFEDLIWAHDYWQDQRGTKVAPAWRDIDLVTFPAGLLPRVCVVDVKTAPMDLTYRFWGTSVTDMHHYDLTGQSVANLTPPEYGECIWRQYQGVLSKNAPLAFLTEVPLERGILTYYAIIRMPLSSDGEVIDGVLSVEQYGDKIRNLRDFFENEISN